LKWIFKCFTGDKIFKSKSRWFNIFDIHMPDFTGFDFIQTIKDPPKVILVTSDKNFAMEAFEYECIVDYLVKLLLKTVFKAIQKQRHLK
jgi:two-component SAPR family response regulator